MTLSSDMPKPRAKPRSPDSRFYDKVKGKEVVITRVHDGSKLTAKLLGVDRYTLVIEVNGVEKLMYKKAIETIEPASAPNKNHTKPTPNLI